MFNIEDFDLKLDTNFIGRNFIYVEEIDSTNSYLMSESENLPNGTVLLSEFQIDGKGRLNRKWYSIKGNNLTFSILFNKKIEKLNINHVNLAASLAVAQSIENLFQLKTELKWPNDILVKNKKLSGILLESIYKNSKLEKFVIGIGINVNQTKFEGEYKVRPTSVKYEAKKEIARERLLNEILNNLENNINELNTNAKSILDEWRDKCRMIGEHITIDSNNNLLHGIFYDIDANGFMILKIGDKLEKITNGDISLK
ncbi:MAG: biotin--[acetyl-CoA-carboxylase] ligase [Ignavibacteriales bacterium]|nr:biotin--[acetyl-CoA-carboxylase] ligase [Ignavibacteriales bacterium]